MNNKSEKQDLKKKVDIHQLENGFGIFLRTLKLLINSIVVLGFLIAIFGGGVGVGMRGGAAGGRVEFGGASGGEDGCGIAGIDACTREDEQTPCCLTD